MKQAGYILTTSSDFTRYQFTSVHKTTNKVIEKLIEFDNTEVLFEGKPVYNLAFGDIEDDGSINDMSESNNGDITTIMRTVFAAIYQYSSQYPNRIIYFSGSTPQRTEFYQTILRRNYQNIVLDFDIYGTNDGDYETFQTGKIYDGFLVARKLNDQ